MSYKWNSITFKSNLLTFQEKHRDAELVRRIGDATALEVRATGIPYVFAPCIAVNNILVYCKYWRFGLYLKQSNACLEQF